MKFYIKEINSLLIESNRALKTSWQVETTANTIEINYNYKGEPNNGRVQLELELIVNSENILDKFQINAHVELPYQYPKSFEIVDSSENKIAIPHSKGVYIIDLEKGLTDLIKYQTNDFQYCYFYEEEFILVESKSIKIVSLSSYKENKIELPNLERILTNGVKILKDEIHVMIRNVDNYENQMLIYNRTNLLLKQTLHLSQLISDDDLIKTIDRKRVTKLAAVPKFKFPSIISSWRYIPNIKKNALVGNIQKWEEPVKQGEYFERIENYGAVEIIFK